MTGSSDTLAPELRFVLCCARPRLDASASARLGILADGPLDWERVLSSATSHGLASLLFRHCVDAQCAGIPLSIVDRLRAGFERTTIQNLRLFKELLDILDLFEANQVPAVPYKGPTLGVSLYGHPGLRPSRDLDLLVRKCDVLRATSLLQERGYAFLHGNPPRDLEHANERQLAADGVAVDLHWRLVSSLFAMRLAAEDIWPHLNDTVLHGRRVRALPDDWLLPVLCVHATSHCWQRLEWLCDVAVLTERVDDWDAVLESSDRIGCRRMLLLGLELARVMIGVDLPDAARAAVRKDASIPRLVEQVTRLLRHPFDPERHPVRTHLFAMAAHDRMVDRIGYFARLAGRPSALDRRLITLPARLDFLYLVMKPFTVGGRALAGAGIAIIDRIARSRT